MDQDDAIAKARQFADTAYGVEADRISRDFDAKLRDRQAELTAHGLVRSSVMTSETARINGERITALLQAKLNSLLEGYSLHGIPLDEQLAARTLTEMMQVRNTMLARATHADVKLGGGLSYIPALEQNVGMYEDEVKTQLERRRLMKRATQQVPPIFTMCTGTTRVGLRTGATTP